MTEKPDFVTEDHLFYLDLLRESGGTNMFGAAPYLQQEFHVNKREAGKILSYWMDTFSDRNKNQ